MINIRTMRAEDRPAVDDMLKATQMFTPAEVAIALELVDLFLFNKDQKDYYVEVAVDAQDQPLGYICYGPTPGTEGTYDLYWIVVAPQFQGQGIGKALLRHLEKKLIDNNSRLIIIETSSTERYIPTQQFYLHNGYTIAARIKDFYRIGDDRLIFTKYLKA